MTSWEPRGRKNVTSVSIVGMDLVRQVRAGAEEQSFQVQGGTRGQRQRALCQLSLASTISPAHPSS